MAIPFFKELRIGGYLIKQKLLGRKRYPLVLMLEPLFRCNLACVGCGKIDYPDAILNRRMSAQECWDAADECGAPMVAIPGGEPLIHKEIGEIVRGLVARKKFVSLCTNALLLEKKLDLFEPSPYLFFSVHLDGLKDHHDKAVSQKGVFDRAVSAIKAAKARGFTVNVNATIFDGHPAEEIAKFLDFTTELGVGVSMSPGYAYERAPDQEHFLNRTKTKKLFRDVFALGKGKKWNFMHSGLFLDFLAGNQEYECTPWGMPARNIFGWQKPCYLLGEGYTKTFKELMDTTDWETYGTGKYEKCADCMAHCGYEPTAANAALVNPLKAMWVALRGIRTTGPMAPEINLDKQRPAQYIFSSEVQKRLSDIRQRRSGCRCRQAAAEGLHGRLSARRHPNRKRPGPVRTGAFSFGRSLVRSDRQRRQISAVARSSPPSRKPRQPRSERSARLKSIPVETSARSVRRIAREAAQHLAQVDIAVRLDGALGQRRQRPAGGIGDHPQRRKGNAGLGRIGRRDMAFHVDRGRPGLGMQRGLAGGRRDHLFDAGKAAADHAPALQRGAGDHFLVQRQTGQKAGIAGQNLGRHHHVARLQRRIEPAGDAERDHTPERRWIQCRKQRAQLLRIATAADHDHAGPGRYAGLLHQSCHDQNRPRINRILFDWTVHGRGGPRPQNHIPTPTTLLLVLLKFRYRASAQSGKNFE